MSKTFNILSLDGGGIRGMFSAAVINHLEQQCNVAIEDHFNLIVGTSTGAIIALGLASGLGSEQILSFYNEFGPKIFSGSGGISYFFRPKYDNDRLIEALKATFGDRTMNDLKTPVCIASYELV